AKKGEPKFPYVLTTYRLTEHYLAGGMSRWLPWLTELQPELFVEISPELAQEKGIKNLDWCKISSPRTQIRAKALVTRRMRPFKINGKVIHQVGMPWHWGYEGLSKGDVVNELTSLIADPNVSMHAGKAFVCNGEKEWNQLPSTNGGLNTLSGDSYDNTRRLDGIHWRHVKFIEQFTEDRKDGRWLLMSDVCKHCVHAACLEVCPTGAIVRTEFDTVVIQSDACNGCRDCIS